MMPAARRTALRSQLRPNSNNRAPMPTWSTVMGIIPSAGPSTPTRAASAASPAAAPRSAERHPRTIPTARTMVTASTHSTRDPRNAAVTEGPACIQSIIGLPPRCICSSVLFDSHPHATRSATMQQIHSSHMEMPQMNWRAFDLNLLVVFDGLFREGSVTRAGRRLGMSQPALSHALNRLRYLLKDQLFIRTPKGMVPTPRAQQLALPLRHALAQMEQALEPETFVAAQANRRFSIAINNYAAIVVAAPLVAAVSAAAGVVLGRSDMVATLSRRVAEAMVRDSASTLQIRELPLTSPTVRTSMLWHRRLDGSAAHRWLRELIVSVCRGL